MATRSWLSGISTSGMGMWHECSGSNPNHGIVPVAYMDKHLGKSSMFRSPRSGASKVVFPISGTAMAVETFIECYDAHDDLRFISGSAAEPVAAVDSGAANVA